MIRKLKVNNFKSIEKLDLDLDKFNLFCGENASGKTSVIHSILALLQKRKCTESLDGELIKIGNFVEIKKFGSNADVVIECENFFGIKSKMTIRKDNSRVSGTDYRIITKKGKKFNPMFEEDFYYLSSDRDGAQDVNRKTNDKFGIDGSGIVDFLVQNTEKLLPDNYMKKFKDTFAHADEVKNPTLLEHVRFWMKHITGESVGLDPIAYTNQSVLTFGNVSNKIRPCNTGTGLRFTLPIIVLCLGAILSAKDNIIIIENPEIHLHPIAQMKLTNFLLFISEFSQFIVETHSDHILKTVLEKECSGNTVYVFDFDLEEKRTTVEKVDNAIFLLSPVSYAEVMYKVLNLPTYEFHNLLFAEIRKIIDNNGNRKGNQTSKTAIKKIDMAIARQKNWISVPLTEKRHFPVTENKRDLTLPAYIRNAIDHPGEGGRLNLYELKEDLEISIKFLIELIRETDKKPSLWVGDDVK